MRDRGLSNYDFFISRRKNDKFSIGKIREWMEKEQEEVATTGV